MVLFRCPRCQVQISVPKYAGDYVHECDSGQDVLDQEDVLVIGPWTDYTGSDTSSVRVSPVSIQNQNIGNKLLGTEGWVRDNQKVPERTVRGNNAQITRTRQHLEYIKDPKQPMG